MKFIDAIVRMQEAKGSEKGREAYTSKKATKDDKKKSFKGRVINYKSIKDALAKGGYGDIFSTKAAGRLYVISKAKWGDKSGKGKIAKGFTPGSSTPGSDFPNVRKHAARTMLRYGKGSKDLAKKYGSRSIRKSKGIGGKDGRLGKGEK
jgi:hypothetical protein